MNKTGRKERNYFEMFSRDFPLPNGEIEYGDKPDVILRGDRTIGPFIGERTTAACEA